MAAAGQTRSLLFTNRLQVAARRCHHVSGARPTAGLGVARVITSDPCGKVPPPLLPQSGTVRAAVVFFFFFFFSNYCVLTNYSYQPYCHIVEVDFIVVLN